MTALGLRADACGVAHHYLGLIEHLLIDHQDADLAQ